jgi:hypothetical protein
MFELLKCTVASKLGLQLVARPKLQATKTLWWLVLLTQLVQVGRTRSHLNNANATRLAMSFKKNTLCKVVRHECGQDHIRILASLPHIIRWALQDLSVRHCVHHFCCLATQNATPPAAAAANETRAELRELSLQRANIVCCWPADE